MTSNEGLSIPSPPVRECTQLGGMGVCGETHLLRVTFLGGDRSQCMMLGTTRAYSSSPKP